MLNFWSPGHIPQVFCFLRKGFGMQPWNYSEYAHPSFRSARTDGICLDPDYALLNIQSLYSMKESQVLTLMLGIQT